MNEMEEVMKRLMVCVTAMVVLTAGMVIPTQEADARPRVRVQGNVGGLRYRGNVNRGWNNNWRYRTPNRWNGNRYYGNGHYRPYANGYYGQNGVFYYYY